MPPEPTADRSASTCGAAKRRVLLADDRKSLFHLISDPRIEIQHAYEPQRAPHLIVIPCPKLNGSFKDSVEKLPVEAWRDVGVVLDASGKGSEPTGKFLRRLHWFLDERAISGERCAFVTNNRRVSLKGSKIRILHYDYWIRKLFNLPEKKGVAAFDLLERQFRSRPNTRPRRFLSFNLTARRWKVLFLLSLLRDGLWDAGYVSFGGFKHLELYRGSTLEDVRRDLLQAPGLDVLAADLVRFLHELDAKGQVLFGEVPRSEAGVVRKATKADRVVEFDRTWFSATTETDMSATADFVTEKPFKAIFNCHPQVILGNAGALARLRVFGFESFSPAIDESYDQEPDPRRRFELAYAEIRRLCSLEEAEMARLSDSLSEVVLSNARRALVGLPTHYREVLDPGLVSSLLSLCPETAGAGA